MRLEFGDQFDVVSSRFFVFDNSTNSWEPLCRGRFEADIAESADNVPDDRRDASEWDPSELEAFLGGTQ